jgi:hypothetical protein
MELLTRLRKETSDKNEEIRRIQSELILRMDDLK